MVLNYRQRRVVAAANQMKVFDRWEMALEPNSPPTDTIIFSKDPSHQCPQLNVARVIASLHRSKGLIGWIDDTQYTLTIKSGTNLTYHTNRIDMSQAEIDIRSEPWVAPEVIASTPLGQGTMPVTLVLDYDGVLTIRS